MGYQAAMDWTATAAHVPRRPHVLWGKDCLLIVRMGGVYLGFGYVDGRWDGEPARVMGGVRAEVARNLQANPPGVPAFIDG
jgi:hypothetical protein